MPTADGDCLGLRTGHFALDKASLSAEDLRKNLDAIVKAKPARAKGKYGKVVTA